MYQLHGVLKLALKDLKGAKKEALFLKNCVSILLRSAKGSKDDRNTFAFDDIEDMELIEKKLQMIRRYYDGEQINFYVLVGFNGNDINDVENAFIRINLLRKYRCLPYIMRYQSQTTKPCDASEWKDIYTNLARWCNQPGFCKKMSFDTFMNKTVESRIKGSKYTQTMYRLKKEYPALCEKYIYKKWGE